MPRDEIDDILDQHDGEALRADKAAPKTDEIDEILKQASGKPDLVDDYSARGVSLLNKAGRGLLTGLGTASKYVDSVTGAPIRAGIGALQKPGGGVSEALSAAGHQFARDPSEAPSGKDIAANAGLSTEETLRSPVTINPWKRSANMMSPAGVVGAGIEAAADPMTYLPGEAVAKGLGLAAKGAEHVAEPVAGYLSRLAEERAVKAALGGGNLAAMRRMAGITAKGGDADQAYNKLRGIGANLLATDEAGAPTIGWGANAKSIGEKASQKADFYGQRIGDVAGQMDQSFPKQDATGIAGASGGSVDGKDIAQKILDYAATVPPHGEGKTVQNRLIEEAKEFQERGPMTFKEVHDAKQQYPHKVMSSDALISNQDATNKIKSILTQVMDESVANAGAVGSVPADLSAQYKEARGKYGSFKPESDAAGEQAVRALSNRFVSPSSYGAGATGAVVAGMKHGLSAPTLAAGIVVGAANKIATERGSALVARSAKLMADKIAAAPETFTKWLPSLEGAARVSGNALSVMHHYLMNNDPDYRERMTQGGFDQ